MPTLFFYADPFFSGWLRAAAKMAPVVTLIIEKNIQKKIISDLPTLIFSRYETGTTGIFYVLLD
jgi:hypothetical protein